MITAVGGLGVNRMCGHYFQPLDDEEDEDENVGAIIGESDDSGIFCCRISVISMYKVVAENMRQRRRRNETPKNYLNIKYVFG